MNIAKNGPIVLAAALSITSACSLAGLDDYASGKGGEGGNGGTGTFTISFGGTGGVGGGGVGGTGVVTSCDGEVCNEACVDLGSDPENCGACGVACTSDYSCVAGVCDDAVVDVSTYLHTCAALAGGEVWCWGRDVYGEIGRAPSMADMTCSYQNDKCQSTPIKVNGISGAVEVATGFEASCARTKAGEVWCWGSNERGLLGHAVGLDDSCNKAGGPNNGAVARCSPTPRKVELPSGVQAAQLVMGSVVACIRTTAKDVYCWGMSANGEVTSPQDNKNTVLPTKSANVSGNAEDLAISTDASGEYSTVCIRRSGTDAVECWGQSVGRTLFYTGNQAACGQPYCNANAKVVYSIFGQSGNPVLADRVGVGGIVGCALRQGAVTCWGNDDYGQSGTGLSSGQHHFDPTPIPGVAGITAIANRGFTTLLLDAQGGVWTLGLGDDGQNGSFAPIPVCPIGNGHHCGTAAAPVEGLPPIAKVASSAQNGAAITKDGRLFMWGSNAAAALGHAPGTEGDEPCAGGLACTRTPRPVSVLH